MKTPCTNHPRKKERITLCINADTTVPQQAADDPVNLLRRST